MKIDVNHTIYQLVSNDESLKQILFDLGFREIVKPGMIQTVGRFMTLKGGASLRKIALEDVVKALRDKGYEVEGA